MSELDSLKIKIFADGADLASIKALCRDPLIRGFTTNPTLMRKAGVADFTAFAREAVEIVGERPISFEVCADDFAEQVGAVYSFTGTVQKVSELILNINVYVHEAATSRPVAVASVDLRGNTDESWRRGIDLYKNVLSPKLEKVLK